LRSTRKQNGTSLQSVVNARMTPARWRSSTSCAQLLHFGFMVALCNRADHIYFHPVVCSFFFLFFLSSPNLSGRRLDVCRTSTHGVALVRRAPEQSGPKSAWGCCAPFCGGGRELSPQLTQCGLGRGLPQYQVASWSIQQFGHNTPTYTQTDRTGQTTVR